MNFPIANNSQVRYIDFAVENDLQLIIPFAEFSVHPMIGNSPIQTHKQAHCEPARRFFLPNCP
jgi:hypothetical protein